jgi:hypothetical protein
VHKLVLFYYKEQVYLYIRAYVFMKLCQSFEGLQKQCREKVMYFAHVETNFVDTPPYLHSHHMKTHT